MRCLPSATSLLFRGRHLTTTFTHSAVLAGPLGPGMLNSGWNDRKPAFEEEIASMGSFEWLSTSKLSKKGRKKDSQ